jgi:hypothetical protein
MLALTLNNLKEMMTVINEVTIFGHRLQNFEPAQEDELPFTLEMPESFDGRKVPSSTVVTALLWQQYGLDMLHPRVNRWLEKYAPDVKNAVAKNKRCDEPDSHTFRVGMNGRLKVHLSPDVDERLRKVSSDYIWWQVEHSLDLENELIEDEAIEQISKIFNDARELTPSMTHHSDRKYA